MDGALHDVNGFVEDFLNGLGFGGTGYGDDDLCAVLEALWGDGKTPAFAGDFDGGKAFLRLLFQERASGEEGGGVAIIAHAEKAKVEGGVVRQLFFKEAVVAFRGLQGLAVYGPWPEIALRDSEGFQHHAFGIAKVALFILQVYVSFITATPEDGAAAVQYCGKTGILTGPIIESLGGRATG